MPTYRYRATDVDQACPTCQGFEVLQRLFEEPLSECPDCAEPIRRVIGKIECMTDRRWHTKKMLSDGNLKRLGFKKLVKEGDGKYRDVLAK